MNPDMDSNAVIRLLERHIVPEKGDKLYCCECKAFTIGGGELHHNRDCAYVAAVRFLVQGPIIIPCKSRA